MKVNPYLHGKLSRVERGQHIVLTTELAGFCLSLRFDELHDRVVHAAKMHILDTLGAAIAGGCKRSTQILMELVRAAGGRQDSTVIGTSLKVPCTDAALVNGEMSHDRGLDDVNLKASVHPGSTIIPAALAVGEMLDSNGKAFLASVVVGYEVMVRTGRAIGPANLYRGGLHPTGIVGPFGSAASAGRLMKLDEDALARAFGIVALFFLFRAQGV